MNKITITYIVHYKYPWCYDDDFLEHDQNWGDSFKVVEVDNDHDAQIASMSDEFRKPEYCYHGRNAYPFKIVKRIYEKTEEGFERTIEEEIPLPQRKRCVCGVYYWPIRDEKPCHELVLVKDGY